MAYPNSTGPDVPLKATTYDVVTNTANFFNGADWNRMRTLVNALQRQMAGDYRGYVERRTGGTLTAVRVLTGSAMVDGYRKTVASGRVLIPGSTGTTYVWARWNVGTAAATIRTAAAEPSPYATATRDMPLAKVVRSGGLMTITHLRPDWVLGRML